MIRYVKKKLNKKVICVLEGEGEGVVEFDGGGVSFGLFWKFVGVDVGNSIGELILGLGGGFSGDGVGLGMWDESISEGEIVWIFWLYV